MRILALALALATSVTAAEAPRPYNTVGEKPFGVLLLGEGGDRDWKNVVDDVKKKAGKRYPVEFSGGQADAKAMQKSLDLLLAQRVRSIVVVPLMLSTHDAAMDEVRYLLGIRETPSKDYLGGPHAHIGTPPARLHSRVPLVLAKPLDDHPLFIELLASRAQTLSRHPEKESLILVGEAPVSTGTAKEWTDAAASLAEKVRQKGKFAAAAAYALREGPTQKDREISESGLRALVKEQRRDRQVIVVPLSLSGKGLRLAHLLDGTFAKHDGRTILPDARIAQWVDESAVPASKLPDMRLFKEAARMGLAPRRQHE